MSNPRIERDSMGELHVPEAALYDPPHPLRPGARRAPPD